MTNDKIRDIPKFRELLDNARNFERFKEAFPILKPFLKAVGIDVSSLEAAFEETDFENLVEQVDQLTSAPDRFNELFAEHGWIMYDDMNLEVATEAIEIAEEEGVEAAEEVLMDYYDPETVQFQLNRMSAVTAFRPRMRLARKALEDYEQERYHACIPVVLSLMDGLVQGLHAKVHGEGRALSSEDADLTAWDSIAAHTEGLERLAHLMRKGRKTLRTEEISVPYRNGIMHGMDLGYDNRLVAAKTWAALFAVKEWALKAERDELEAPEEDESEPSIFDSIRKLQQARKTREHAEAWEPRTIEVGNDIPETGAPEAYREGTPTRALVEFLSYWIDGNYGYMAESLKNQATGAAEDAGQIRSEFEETKLESFRILEVEDFSSVFTDITLELKTVWAGQEQEKTVWVRMTHMDEDGGPAIRDIEEGSWHLTTRFKLLGPGSDEREDSRP